ncbi:retrovirus-related pol polyprotein from transposon TNT 1-94 [Tanacetum coccineum]
MYVASLKNSENYKAQPYQYASPSKQILKAKAKPYPPCTHCGFNDHRPGDCRNYPECAICGSYDHFTSGHNCVILVRGGVLAESSQSSESLIGVSCNTCGSNRHIKEPIWYLDSGCSRSVTGVKSYMHKDVEQPGPKIRTDNGTEFRNFELESFCNEKGISQDFSSPYTPEQNGVAEKKNRTLIEAVRTMLNGLVDDGYFLGYSFVSKAFRVFNTRRQQIEETYHVTFDESMEATSSHPAPHDKWSRDQHIKLVNIIGEPTEGTLTRSMAAKMTAASASECLFADFLSEIEPKKVSEALKHPGWVDVMQEELNQNKKNELGTMAKNKAILVAQGYSQEEGIYYNETFTPIARIEAIRIFLAFATYISLSDGCQTCLLEWKARGRSLCQIISWIDNTLFIFKTKGDVLLVQVYVDDIIFGLTNYKLCEQFEILMTKKFEMSMMGKLTYFLGFKIKKDDKGISIYQEKYTRNLLNKYEIFDSSSVKTPMVPPNNLGPDLAGKPDLILKDTQTQTMLVAIWTEKAPQVPVNFLEGNWFVGVQRNNSQWLCPMLSAISISSNPVLHSRTKHIDIRYHFIRDYILKEDIELHFILTEFQLADIFIKPMDEPTFTRLKAKLGMLNID